MSGEPKGLESETGIRLAVVMLALGAVILMLGSCTGDGADSSALFGSACPPFDPDATHSCIISSERWSEITQLPEPAGMYRYCAWPGLLSGDYRTRYRDVEGAIHDFTESPAQTPSFLLEALKGADNAPATNVIDYRMIPATHACPNTPP